MSFLQRLRRIGSAREIARDAALALVCSLLVWISGLALLANFEGLAIFRYVNF